MVKLLSQSKEEERAVIELTTDELLLIFHVLNQVKSGPNAFSNEDWQMLIGKPRELEASILDELEPIVSDLVAD